MCVWGGMGLIAFLKDGAKNTAARRATHDGVTLGFLSTPFFPYISLAQRSERPGQRPQLARALGRVRPVRPCRRP